MELPSARPRGPEERRGEPAVRQPSTPASETQSDATGVLSEQFSFIVLSSWFIKASRGVFARDFP